MTAPDPKCADCPLTAVAETPKRSPDALWLLLAAPLEPRAFNRALAERTAAPASSSSQVRA